MNCRHSIKKIIPLLAAIVFALSVHAQVYDITKFGAVGDGTTDNTAAIQRAIDSCTRTGGQVYFPSGTFLSATLYLKSNTTLHLSAGATLLGQPDTKRYPYQDAGIRFYGDQWAKQALIFCKAQTNVSIEGAGTIDGQGAKFIVTTIKKPDRYRDRPYLLWFAGCRNVTVRGVHLQNSAFWMQHYLGCEFVTIDNVHIWNHSNKNNDMMDIDGCKNVTISNVTGDSDDDGITIKSTSPLISENISITNCLISSHCNALKFGTESTGGFRNVVIANCIIRPSAQRSTIYGKPDGNSGISLEMADGGIMENISINNIAIEGPQVPIFIRLSNRARKHIDEVPTPPVGRIRNVHLSNITAIGADETGCSITGLTHSPLEDVSLSNISIETKGTDSTFRLDQPVPEKEDEYPEASMFGKLPAYGFYIRHVKGISISGLRVRTSNTDTRPGIIMNDVSRFSFTGVSLSSNINTPACIYLMNSQDGNISNSTTYDAGKIFLLKDKNSIRISSDKPIKTKPQ